MKQYAKGKNHGMYTHGMNGTRPHRIWCNMLARCRNPKRNGYVRYGGRGIKVCDRWLKFEAFWKDMESGYKAHLTIDRLDNNGNYEPSNCKWATTTEQLQNKRTVPLHKFKGKLLTIPQVASHLTISAWTLRYRLQHGWTFKEAIKLPSRNRTMLHGLLIKN